MHKWYRGLALASALLSSAAFGQGQQIVTTLTGTELFNFQGTGPQFAAISATNLAAFVNTGGGGGSPGVFTTLSASSTVSGTGFTARFATPGPIGNTTPSTGAFTTLTASTSVTLSPSGTVTINPTTTGAVDSVNIGANTAGTGAFTTLSASSTVSGTGFSTYLASPPAIGGTAPAAGTFTTFSATGAVTLSPANLGVAISPTGSGTVTINPATASTINNASIGVTTPLAGKFTTLQYTTNAGLTVAVTTDSGQSATATLCEDTTSHVVYFGSGTAGICKGTSSIRFKEKIAEVAYGLPEILQLQPVSYYTKPEFGDPTKKLFGFLAEDMATVMPQGVTEYDAKGAPSSVDYVAIIPVLVNAIKEQQAQIEQLKAAR